MTIDIYFSIHNEDFSSFKKYNKDSYTYDEV